MSLATNTYTCPVTGLTILHKPELNYLRMKIRYLEEKEDKIRQQETLKRLDKIIRSRNEKAKTYWNSLRPGSKLRKTPEIKTGDV